MLFVRQIYYSSKIEHNEHNWTKGYMIIDDEE